MRLEVAIALLASVAVWLAAPVHLYAAIARAGLAAALTAPALIALDPPTLGDAALALVRALFVVVPVVVAFTRARVHRWAWAPLAVPPLLLALSLAPHGLVGIGPMLVLALSSIGAVAAQRSSRLRWCAAAPILLALHPTATTHQKWTDVLPFTSQRLAARCRENDGERPRGLDRAVLSPLYYSITPVTADRLLLVGEGNVSYWVMRDATGALSIAEPSRVTGNYWHGTHGHDLTWLGHRDDVLAIAWVGDAERVRHIDLRGVREPWEVDALDAVYEAHADVVLVGELASGSLIEVPIAEGATPRRHELGLFYLQLAPSRPGEVVGVSTTELVTIGTAPIQLRQRMPAALCAGGVASCPLDGAVAVSDFAGRVRLFDRDGEGSLHFTQSVAARSPRRVAFSADCSLLAVTSADDTTLTVLRRRDLSTATESHLGPGLRDVYWMPDGDLLAVDACTVTRLHPSE